LRLGLKDAKLALAAGDETAVPLPVGNALRDHYLEAIAHGDADRDWSAVSIGAAKCRVEVAPSA